MTNYSATIPVKAALFERWTAALAAQKDIAVTRGALVGRLNAEKVLSVGTDDPNAMASLLGSSKIDWHGLGARSREEVVVVWSTLTCRTGSTDLTIVEEEADAILQVLQDDLFGNPLVGGARQALISETAWATSQSKQGSVARCVFAVTAMVRLAL